MRWASGVLPDADAPSGGDRPRAGFRPTRADVLPAAGLFVLGAFLYPAGAYPFFGGEGTFVVWAVPPGWRLLPLAGACAAVLVRRHRPGAALGAGTAFAAVDALFGFGIPMLLVLCELLHNAALRGSQRSTRVLLRAVLLAAAAAGVLTLVLLRDGQAAVLLVILVLTVLFVPVWWALELRRERELADAERARADQQATIAEFDRRSAVAEERSRMARDLHDVIAGHLSAIALQADAARSLRGDPGAMEKVTAGMRENSLAALGEMRAMIELLRGPDPEADDLPQTAPARLSDPGALLDSVRAAGLEPVPLGAGDGRDGDAVAEVPGPPAFLDPLPDGTPAAVELAAHRILREAVTNAVKHGRGPRLWLGARVRDGRLRVEVVNEMPDGATDEPARRAAGADGTGIGLLTMRERAAEVGGTITAGEHDGRWRVRAVLPLDRRGGDGHVDPGSVGR
ncbi:sensor histidine kinase [Streptomyces alkaliphilus]|uniref:sensor histidine kinase n=1 Tax=Streptomyces alkaliphilus TaxID=1472722 RepID=UPI0015FB8EE6|nr:histidine kinase [Streptomyces alkaliphilus]